MFQIDISKYILNIDGSAALFQGQPLPMRQILLNSLTGLVKEDESATMAERMFRVNLAKRIMHVNRVSFDLSEVIMLVPLINRTFPHPSVISAFLKEIEDSVVPAWVPNVPPVVSPDESPMTDFTPE